MSDEHILVIFPNTNLYSVVPNPNGKFKSSKKLKLQMEDGSWKTGDIMYRGTYSKCTKKGDKYVQNGELQTSTAAEDADDRSGSKDPHTKKNSN